MRLRNYINITYYVSSYTIFSFISYQNWFMFFSVTPHVAEETYLDLTKVNTPVHTAMLARLLRDTNFDRTESEFLVDGFTNGFSLGYQGPQDC